MTKTNTGTEDTKKKIKQRIFYPEHIYIADKNNIVFANGKTKEELEGYKYDDTDTVLIAVHPSQFFKHVSKVTAITIDFTNSVLTIEGNKATLAKIEFEEGETQLEADDLKEWADLIGDAYRICNNTVVIGTPPIEGVCLDD